MFVGCGGCSGKGIIGCWLLIVCDAPFGGADSGALTFQAEISQFSPISHHY